MVLFSEQCVLGQPCTVSRAVLIFTPVRRVAASGVRAPKAPQPPRHGEDVDEGSAQWARQLPLSALPPGGLGREWAQVTPTTHTQIKSCFGRRSRGVLGAICAFPFCPWLRLVMKQVALSRLSILRLTHEVAPCVVTGLRCGGRAPAHTPLLPSLPVLPVGWVFVLIIIT